MFSISKNNPKAFSIPILFTWVAYLEGLEAAMPPGYSAGTNPLFLIQASAMDVRINREGGKLWQTMAWLQVSQL